MTVIKESYHLRAKNQAFKRMHNKWKWRTSRFNSTRFLKILLLCIGSISLLCIYLCIKSINYIFYLDKSDERCQILFTSTAPKDLIGYREMNLKGCSLSEIPSSIKYATNLEKLDISDNPSLTTLPSELKFLTKLDILFISSCPLITEIPSVLGEMSSIRRLGWRSGSLASIQPDNIPPNLVHLILTDNRLEYLDDPKIFLKLKYVRKLMLSHNNIREFGTKGGLDQLESLELLRLAGNQLKEIPSELWKLPKLTWLTISGNPFTDQYKLNINNNLPSIHQNDLLPTGIELGEGASGQVKLYTWKENREEVAVKLIHGVTSDGKAEDELAIYRAVGPNGLLHRVIGCIAVLEDNSRKGVVMPPLPNDLVDLALPPTIREVTTDRWDSNAFVVDSEFVKSVLKDATTALDFLHNIIGVSHGDFYAHNMKVDPLGRSFLLDFGASFFKGDIFSKEAEKLEVRAFGVLVGELVRLLDSNEEYLIRKLLSLHSQCTDVNIHSRPSFREIKSIINEL